MLHKSRGKKEHLTTKQALKRKADSIANRAKAGFRPICGLGKKEQWEKKAERPQ